MHNYALAKHKALIRSDKGLFCLDKVPPNCLKRCTSGLILSKYGHELNLLTVLKMSQNSRTIYNIFRYNEINWNVMPLSAAIQIE